MLKFSAISYATLCVASLATAGPLEELPQHSQPEARLHASGQPAAESFAALREAGIATVIDLRPDEETPQLDERAVADAAGLKYESLPISGRAGLTRENVVAFDGLLRKHAGEMTLAHCSTSNRVGALLALRAAWLQGKPAQEAVALGEKAGLKGLKADVEALLQSSTPASAGP